MVLFLFFDLLDFFSQVDTDAKIHAFEPATDTYTRYFSRFKDIGNVKCNNIGLSDKVQTLRLYKSKASSGLASLYNTNKFEFNSFEDISLSTIDDYCLLHHIKIIDFLKMDVEGHELAVLKGAKGMLESKGIKIIQFEFGTGNISSRSFFKDFYDLLNSDFNIFRIVKNGLVQVEHYNYSLEIFGRVTNYVAISKSIKL